jgi:hypothetical protein
LNVQEQPQDWGEGGAYTYSIIPLDSDASGRSLELRFTDFTALKSRNGHHRHIYSSSSSSRTFNLCRIQDCRFYNERLFLGAPGSAEYRIRNNLFDSVRVYYYYYPEYFIYNNLHHRGYVYFYRLTSQPWYVRDNVFHACKLKDYKGGLSHDHNAYVHSGPRLAPEHPGDVVLRGFSYEPGPLGPYYHGSDALMNRGSRSAAQAGLYHHTVQPGQNREAGSTVDIGYHYLALNAAGDPLDSDGEGLADWIEDKNGNGSRQTGESRWKYGYSDTDGDGFSDYEEWLLGRDPTIAGAQSDLTGSIGFKVYTPSF